MPLLLDYLSLFPWYYFSITLSALFIFVLYLFNGIANIRDNKEKSIMSFNIFNICPIILICFMPEHLGRDRGKAHKNGCNWYQSKNKIKFNRNIVLVLNMILSFDFCILEFILSFITTNLLFAFCGKASDHRSRGLLVCLTWAVISRAEPRIRPSSKWSGAEMSAQIAFFSHSFVE